MRVLLALLVLSSVAVAQGVPETGRVAGVVTWDETGEPLIAATVLFPDLRRGAATDIEGRFVVEDLPVGTHAVRVSYVGFEPFDAEVTVRAGGVSWLHAALAEAPVFSCDRCHCYDPVAHPRSAYAARRVVYDARGTDRCFPTEGMTEAVAR